MRGRIVVDGSGLVSASLNRADRNEATIETYSCDLRPRTKIFSVDTDRLDMDGRYRRFLMRTGGIVFERDGRDVAIGGQVASLDIYRADGDRRCGQRSLLSGVGRKAARVVPN